MTDKQTPMYLRRLPGRARGPLARASLPTGRTLRMLRLRTRHTPRRGRRRMSSRYRFPPCTECGQPVTCGQGARHLSCSPLCRACYGRIPTTGHKCTPKSKGSKS